MESFKSSLEKICEIIEWDPSFDQLIKIKKALLSSINEGKRLSKTSCQGIIARHCPNTIFYLKEGVDNSDLNALLMIAIASVKK